MSSGEDKNITIIKKHVLESREGRVMEGKKCFIGNKEGKFPLAHKMRKKLLMFSVAVKFLG